ncbi:Hypothetical protein (plasmid) [Pseudomonas putida]|nr:Hypothetical protein [Pseudomonas putida]
MALADQVAFLFHALNWCEDSEHLKFVRFSLKIRGFQPSIN